MYRKLEVSVVAGKVKVLARLLLFPLTGAWGEGGG